MRYLLPAMAAAAAAVIGVGSASAGLAASQAPVRSPQRQPARVESHISLHLSRHAILDGQRVDLRGRVRPGGRRRVKVVIRGRRGDVLRARTKANGVFELRWRPSRFGPYRIRAYAIHEWRARGSESVARRLTAYHYAVASYYGPGLYGGALACGGTLQPGTLGVAHKTLPCGADVKLRYRGRSLTVPVVDRGPYVAGRDFDLTAATKARLGFPDLGVLLFSRGG